MTQTQNRVTKAYAERRAKYSGVPDAFGVDKTSDGIKNNIGLTLVQREDVWHPYYESTLEEEDLGAKFRRNLDQKKQMQAVGGQAIEALETQLTQLEQQQREEEEQKNSKGQPSKPQKKMFDASALMKSL